VVKQLAGVARILALACNPSLAVTRVKQSQRRLRAARLAAAQAAPLPPTRCVPPCHRSGAPGASAPVEGNSAEGSDGDI
jgi:hypothetical protein